MDLSERRAREGRRHPWETERARFFAREARALAGGPARVLDVGSGDGFFAEKLACALGPGTGIACVDVAYTDEDLAEPLPAGVSRHRELPDAVFDGLVLLDLLEHVEDDEALLRDVVRRARSGGWALVAVPAWPALYSSHDVRLGHYQRYRPAEARRLLEGAGLRVVTAGGLFSSLLPVRAAQKVLQDAGVLGEPGDLGTWRHGRVGTALARAMLRADSAAGLGMARLGWDVPGTTWWAACRVP